MRKPNHGRYLALRRRIPSGALAAVVPLLALRAESARAVLGIYVSGGDVTNSAYVNQSIGATSLYNDFTITPTVGAYSFVITDNVDNGSGAVLSVIDLGYIDNTNTALTRVGTYFGDTASPSPTTTPPSADIGEHATAVAMFGAGQGPVTNGMTPTYQYGIAPGATVWSGSVISSGDPNGTSSQYTVTDSSFIDPFVEAMQTGINGVKTDVINVSLGDSSDLVGEDSTTVALDGLIAQNHTTVVIAAGNSGPSADTVGSPASGYNGIAVGAIAADPNLAYNTIAGFSSRGPNDFYNPYTQVTTTGVRAAVDIVAPGDEFVISQNGDTISYGSGTSYAAPLVAGAATLLSSMAHQLASDFSNEGYPSAVAAANDANDGRVIKAILLNSADKLPGWNNGQTMVNGVLTTMQALDYTQGAGALNVARAADNYLNGQFDPKVVGKSAANLGTKGWDLSTVTKGVDNLYDLGQISSGTTLTATLAWFVDRAYDSATQTSDEGTFVNLNLDVYEVVGGSDKLIAVSETPYENVQQLSFALPATSDYVIGVNFAGVAYGPADVAAPTNEDYAVAWSDVAVPEPASCALLIVGSLMLRRSRRLK
jgi:hypothetical protein